MISNGLDSEIQPPGAFSRRSYCQLAAAALVGLRADAQTQAVTESKHAKVDGVVLNQLTGAPIPHAEVTLRPVIENLKPVVVMADTSGVFSMPNVPPGTYRVSADRVGFIKQDLGSKSRTTFGTRFNLVERQVLSGLTVRLMPKGVIAGRVVNEEGEPVRGVLMQAFRYTYVRGARQLSLVGVASAVSDLGEYRISDLDPGQYFIAAAPASDSSTGRIQSGAPRYPITYFPSGEDLASAQKVVVGGGKEIGGINFSMKAGDSSGIRGVVVSGESGKPLYPASILVFPRMKDQLIPIRAGTGYAGTSDGSFEISNLRPGPYFVAAHHTAGSAITSSFAEVTVTKSGLSDLRLPIGSGKLSVSTTLYPGGDSSKPLPVSCSCSAILSPLNCSAILSPLNCSAILSLAPNNGG